jgi:cytochrome d ubiquinol oxidase subunit II
VILEDLALALMGLGLVAYALLGGADFGAGFWDLTAGGARRGARVRGLIGRSMAPVWEANHVWLIFVLVVFWTAFPVAFGAVMETLYVPIFLAGVGIIFRGAAFAVRGEAATIAEARALGAMFALSSVLIPFFLGVTIGAVASGRVPAEGGGDALESWLAPTPIFIGALAVATGAYISAVFLAADARRGGLDDLVRAFRARALSAALVAGALALGGLFVVREDVPDLYEGLTSGGGLAMVIVSALAGVATLALIWRSRFQPARYTSAAAVATIVVGWALAQRPYFLPEELTLEQAAAGEPTLLALLVSVGVAMLILLPSLALLYALVLRGRLDTEFRPITAADEGKPIRKPGRRVWS